MTEYKPTTAFRTQAAEALLEKLEIRLSFASQVVLLSDYVLIHRPSSVAWSSRVSGSRKEQSAEIRSLDVDLC
jgi:hypothetical protein